MIVFTSICANYLPKAKVLASTLKQHNPGTTFVLCLVERKIDPASDEPEKFDLVIPSGDLGINNFESFIFRHSIVEASTAVKGLFFKELLKRFPEEQEFVYLDPDILVTGPFIELQEVLQSHNIVLTPHLCKPEETRDAVLDNELCALKHGVFNLGFLAIRRSEEAAKFIDWWAKRLEEFCYDDIASGLFTDQRWMNFAPCFFNVYVLKHEGYNAAPWNLSQRHITVNERGEYVVGDDPLRFFHFSGFDSGANEAMILKYTPDKSNVIFKIRNDYLEMLSGAGQKELENSPWTYDYYSNGDKINNKHRVYYRSNRELQLQYKEPFNVNASPSFYAEIIKASKLRLLTLRTRQLISSVRLLLIAVKDAYRAGGIKFVIKSTLNYLLKL